MLGGGGGGGGGGAMGQFPLEQWFYEMPVCTRWWTVATVTTSLLVQCHIITPFQLFYSFRAVFVKNQVRLLPPLHPSFPIRSSLSAPTEPHRFTPPLALSEINKKTNHAHSLSLLNKTQNISTNPPPP